jgi:hypothetical protein
MMKIKAKWLARLNNGEDPEEVMQNYFDMEGPGDYLDYLQHLCEIGGLPNENEDPELAVKDAVISGGKCHVKIEAFFDEKVNGCGCPDMPTLEPRNGDAECWVDLATGDVAWQADDLEGSSLPL